jgi:hypothetical protein
MTTRTRRLLNDLVLLVISATLVSAILLTGAAVAQELVTLTTPETKPSNTAYHIDKVNLDVDAGALWISLKGITDEVVVCTYNATTNPTGASLILGLNKANLSTAYAANATTGSLKQRIAHRLIVMGESATVCTKTLVGTLTGTVQ